MAEVQLRQLIGSLNILMEELDGTTLRKKTKKQLEKFIRGVTKMTKIYTTIKETAAMIAVGTIGGAIAWGVMELEQLAKAWQF